MDRWSAPLLMSDGHLPEVHLGVAPSLAPLALDARAGGPAPGASLMRGTETTRLTNRRLDALGLPDATDVLVRAGTGPDLGLGVAVGGEWGLEGRPAARGPGVLLLADGSRFTGELWGGVGLGSGELVFTTGMAGYQESLTDPSFAGQVLTFTWPILGSYGIHAGMSESGSVWPRGVIAREVVREADHRDSIADVEALLVAHGVPGLRTVDTRELTLRVRQHGVLLCAFGPVEREEEVTRLLETMVDPSTTDLMAEVVIDELRLLPALASDAEVPRLAVLDCGIKHNILRQVARHFEPVWVPPATPFDVLVDEWKVDALFASNGPGNPAHRGAALQARHTIAEALDAGMPTMGICMGHQLLGLATGAATYKLRYGHRGANQPVVDLVSGRVAITSQNHGFAVAEPGDREPPAAHPAWRGELEGEDLVGVEVKARHVNANDRTLEGLDVIGRPAFSIQFHPEAAPGPHDAQPLFARFASTVNSRLDGRPRRFQDPD